MQPKIIIFLIGISSLIACKHYDKEKNETTTIGKVNVAVDETIQRPIEEEDNAFEYGYKNANVNAQYLPEELVFDKLMKDSVEMVIATRKLTKNEQIHFDNKNITPTIVTIGYDAVALLVNKNNPDSLLKFDDIQALLKGEKKKWSEFNPKGSNQDVNIVFDNSKSSTVRYLMDTLGVQKLPTNAYAATSNAEVIEYVGKNKASLGILGMSWVVNLDKKQLKNLKDKATIVYIFNKNNKTGRYHTPDMDNIVSGNYPFYRNIYVINCEGHSGVATGFTSYVISQVGQLILLKAGIVPFNEVNRTVNAHH